MAHLDTVNAIIDAWKSGGVDAVLAHLHDDVEYHYHVGSKPLLGIDAVREFLVSFGADQTDIAWRITHHAEAGRLLFVEGVDDYVNAQGVRIRTPYAGVFEFQDGKVWRWRDYVDMRSIDAARSGKPPPPWIEALL